MVSKASIIRATLQVKVAPAGRNVRLFSFLTALLCLATTALAQDPAKTDPKHFKVEFESEQVRVLRVKYGPGENSPMYALPPHVLVPITDYHVKDISADGNVFKRQAIAGTTIWRDSVVQANENSTDAPIEAVVVELSRKPAVSPDIFRTGWPTEFSKSVHYDQEAFIAFARRVKDGQRISGQDATRATNAIEDLELKSAWVKQPGISSPMVTGTVNTVDETHGKGVPGCEVWYVPYAWQDDPSRNERFDKLSTPTTKLLPVGRFLMWTRKSAKEGERKPVNPGDDHKTKKEVDIPAPR